MGWVTYKNRTSENYKFTTDRLSDPAIADLKAMVKQKNEWIKNVRKNPFISTEYNTQGVWIRPRGPRVSAWAKDTRMEDATHYDVYVRDYYRR